MNTTFRDGDNEQAFREWVRTLFGRTSHAAPTAQAEQLPDSPGRADGPVAPREGTTVRHGDDIDLSIREWVRDLFDRD